MVGYCPICGKPVYFGEKKRSLGRDYHPLCLKCQRCCRQLTAGQHAEYDEKPYCSYCYMKIFGPRGNKELMPRCCNASPRDQTEPKQTVKRDMQAPFPN